MEPVVPFPRDPRAALLTARALAQRVHVVDSCSLAVQAPADLRRMAELVERYSDFPLGGTDASIVALAERLGAATIITLDRRHFGSVKPKHVESFKLVP
jgi:predicted nucleic acid-binding protein